MSAYSLIYGLDLIVENKTDEDPTKFGSAEKIIFANMPEISLILPTKTSLRNSLFGSNFG